MFNSPHPTNLDKNHVFLVVDDFDTMRRVTVNQLRLLGAEKIVSARNGLEAMRILKHQSVDMVLSDWNMPVMNGLELLQAIRADADLAHLPFVMVTAEAERSRVEQAIAAGISSLLLKPYSPAHLMERIQISFTARPRAPVAFNVDPSAKRRLMGKLGVSARQTSAAKPSILVVDDTPDNLTLLSELLKEEYKVQVCTNGAKALEICFGDTPPDLVLLDIMMPEMDGFEVARQMSEHPNAQYIPVIFVTAIEGVDARIKGLNLGAVDYIAKPVNPDLLKPRVRNFMRFVQIRKNLKADYEQMVETAHLREDVEHITRHDLKGPLAGVIGLLQNLIHNDHLGRREREQLELIEETTNQVMQLVNLSNTLYQIETGKFELQPRGVDVGGMLRRIAEIDSVTFSAKELKLVVDTNNPGGSDMPEAWADPMLCYSAFQNLVKNACEAAPIGSTVAIRVQDQDPLQISIANEGAVPEPIRERFFEKYVTHGKEGGTGLGTYSAKLLTQVQGGTIELKVDDAADTTTLRITLPRLH